MARDDPRVPLAYAPATEDELVVAVVTFNSEHLVRDLVSSLGGAMSCVPWRLVVVDNDSRDGTIAAVRAAAPQALVVAMGRNAGYAAGINAAVAAVGPGRAVLVLNPDVRLAPDCVTALLAALDEPDVGIAVPRLVDGDGQLVCSLRREPSALRAAADAFLGAERAGRWWRLGEVVTDPTAYAGATTTDWAEGSTQLVRPECWRQCGPWDESYFLYSEETDFHLRARDAGWRTRFVPQATAVHLGGESTTSPALWSLLVANRLRLYARRRGPLRAVPYWLMLLAREASRALLGKPTSRRAARTLLSPARLRAARGPQWLG